MQITVRYQSIDGVNTRKSFGTLAGVRRYVDKMVGKGEFSSSGMYAVSNDGVGKVTLVEVMNNTTGRKLNSLAAVMQEPAKAGPFEVWVDIVNEDRGTSSPSKDGTFATLAEAVAQVAAIEAYADGARIVATTDEAQAELDVLRFDANATPDMEAF